MENSVEPRNCRKITRKKINPQRLLRCTEKVLESP